MGAQCSCLKDPRNQQEEFQIGSGIYSFKKAVYIILIDIYNIYIVFSKNNKWK